MSHFNQVIDQLAEKFRSVANGKIPVNFFNEINRATLDAIALVSESILSTFIYIGSLRFKLINIFCCCISDCIWNAYGQHWSTRFRIKFIVGKDPTRHARHVLYAFHAGKIDSSKNKFNKEFFFKWF